MTQPPEDPWDPNRLPPHTRAFDPDQNPAEYPDSGYPQTGYGQTGYDQSGYPQGAYTQGYGQEPGGPPPTGPYGEPPSGGSGGGGRRTLILALAVIAALVLIVVVAVLVVRSTGGGDSTASPTTTSTVSATSSTTTPTTTTTTETTTEETTTARVPAGAVVYQLTGSGDVAGVRYRKGSEFVIDPVTAAPWSMTTTVTGGSAELTAIVVRGPVTCTIMHGREQLTSTTSNGGLLRCVADLPN
ncbi:hypothetical protein [Gordonia polyisoprenivorans]|uniref:hypothetical protein n=1 Tax=Gordonia polyisoprenivorans TaxID=84595 RepID=UPI001EE6389E|nr:hypothetical protein [Gordonia polyisoprenivorans]